MKVTRISFMIAALMIMSSFAAVLEPILGTNGGGPASSTGEILGISATIGFMALVIGTMFYSRSQAFRRHR